jgi:hypothetical protein
LLFNEDREIADVFYHLVQGLSLCYYFPATLNQRTGCLEVHNDRVSF